MNAQSIGIGLFQPRSVSLIHSVYIRTCVCVCMQDVNTCVHRAFLESFRVLHPEIILFWKDFAQFQLSSHQKKKGQKIYRNFLMLNLPYSLFANQIIPQRTHKLVCIYVHIMTYIFAKKNGAFWNRSLICVNRVNFESHLRQYTATHYAGVTKKFCHFL